MNDSSEEFEDAVDTLPPLPSVNRPNDFGVGTPRMNSGSSNFSKMEVNPQSTRRNRLATLRNRMQSEFGGNTGLAGDDDASQSDRTSLASWGRNLLMERSNDSSVIAVCPADSLSTKAMPVMQNSQFFDWPNNSTSFGFDTPSKPNNNRLLNKTHDTLVNSSVYDQTMCPTVSFSPSSPPPSLPPPPLPERPTNFNNSPPVPPPLPPRKHATQPPASNTKLQNVSLLNDTDASFKSCNDSDVNESIDDKMKITIQNNVHVSEDSIKSGSNTPNVLDSYGKKRGHAKTNSLDRGLSLAKSIKSGPFPPPQSASKANSLNRGYSPNEMLAMGSAICEEDQAAHNVIEQIADSILSNCDTDEESSSVDTDDARKERMYPSKAVNSDLVAVGEESSSTSTPTKIPTVSQTTASLKTEIPIAKPSPIEIKNRRYENLYNIEPKSEEMHHSEEPCSTLVDLSISHPTEALEKPAVSLSDSIDPITRDVARRMSMKDGKPHAEEDVEAEVDGASSVHKGLEHAKNIVKNYGAMAGGFFKGAFTKAKKTIHVGNSNPPKALSSKDEDDEGASASDDGTPSVSENIPPSVNPQPANRKPEPETICRPKNHKKGPYDFDQLRVVQELNNEHSGAVWVVKFSICGRLLATAGQDNIVRIWVLKNHLSHFAKVRERLNQQSNKPNQNHSGMNDELSFAMQDIENEVKKAEGKSTPDSGDGTSSRKSPDFAENASANHVLMAPKPFCTYRGHTADVLDVSWSRNYFILSCGMDRTVRLWHLARSECLCCFQHMDFVTCISFMPKDDRYFISGSMDGKIRLWHIPEKKVALWNEVEQVKFITAITFVRNGKFVVVGTFNGRCFFYTTDQLKYHTVIDVRSSSGKNSKGHKITSLAVHGDKLLVTSNDSRIRMYDLRDMDLTCKFKGAQIEQSQIRATFSPDGKHIICGSEDNYAYIWRTQDFSPSLSVRKDRNPMWERVKAHNSVVTAAIFAPKPQLFLSLLEDSQRISHSGTPSVQPQLHHSHDNLATRTLKRMDSDIVSTHGALPLHIPSVVDNVNVGGSSAVSASSSLQPKDRQLQGDIIVSADLTGCIKILANPDRIKTGSSHFFVADYN